MLESIENVFLLHDVNLDQFVDTLFMVWLDLEEPLVE